MKVYQLTYTAQIAAKDDVDFRGISKTIEYCLANSYSGAIIVDSSQTELENDNEIIVS